MKYGNVFQILIISLGLGILSAITEYSKFRPNHSINIIGIIGFALLIFLTIYPEKKKDTRYFLIPAIPMLIYIVHFAWTIGV
ncbi:hypothetical protein IJ596_02145 [bacterium]|nr:hypothetical protein [bacterium]